MHIWVDADACPAVIKEMLFRAAQRTQTLATLIANHPLKTPPSPYIRFMQVSHGFDVADNEIVQRMAAGDLVITSDIPLAAEVIENKGMALSPRGELFTQDNIKARLTMRDFMETMRSSGIMETSSQPSFSQKDRHAFASQLDRLLGQEPL